MDMDIAWIEARVQALAAALRSRLSALQSVTLHDLGTHGNRCGIVSFSVRTSPAMEVKHAMQCERVQLSVSSPSSTLIDATKRQLPFLVSVDESTSAYVTLCTLAGACLGALFQYRS
jgi:hypothetical protein